MTTQTLTTEDDYNNAPVGTIAVDPEGWAWQKISTTTHADGKQDCEWRATKEDSLGDVLEGYSLYAEARGPHTVVYTPNQTTEPQEPYEPTEEPPRAYTTEADLKKLKNATFGTIVKDTDGTLWVKANHGWAYAGVSDSLSMMYAPYTIVHTPPSDLANL